MNKKSKYQIALFMLALPLAVFFGGCRDDDPGDHLEDAGESMGEAAEETGERIEDAAN